jgi:hypothetical protein
MRAITHLDTNKTRESLSSPPNVLPKTLHSIPPKPFSQTRQIQSEANSYSLNMGMNGLCKPSKKKSFCNFSNQLAAPARIGKRKEICMKVAK